MDGLRLERPQINALKGVVYYGEGGGEVGIYIAGDSTNVGEESGGGGAGRGGRGAERGAS